MSNLHGLLTGRFKFKQVDRKKHLPPGGVSYLLFSLIKNPEEEDSKENKSSESLGPN